MVINHVGVFIYNNKNDSVTKLPIGKMMLKDVQLFLNEIGNAKSRKYCFKLKSKESRVYNCEFLLASSLKEERDSWVTKILEGVGEALLNGIDYQSRKFRRMSA